jgi:hypothetical protein
MGFQSMHKAMWVQNQHIAGFPTVLPWAQTNTIMTTYYSLTAAERTELATGHSTGAKAALTAIEAYQTAGGRLFMTCGTPLWATSTGNGDSGTNMDNVVNLLTKQPYFAGMHLDVEPWADATATGWPETATLTSLLTLYGTAKAKLAAANSALVLSALVVPLENNQPSVQGRKTFMHDCAATLPEAALAVYNQPNEFNAGKASFAAFHGHPTVRWWFGINALKPPTIGWAGTPMATFETAMATLDTQLKDATQDPAASQYLGMIFYEYTGLKTIIG